MTFKIPTSIDEVDGFLKGIGFNKYISSIIMHNFDLSHSNMICSRHSIPFNMMLHPTSFSVHPYMEFGFTNGRNVLWYLLDIMGISFSGGASSGASFMQASVLFARNATYKPDLIKDTVLYFQALKDSFGLAKDYYSNKNKEDD